MLCCELFEAGKLRLWQLELQGRAFVGFAGSETVCGSWIVVHSHSNVSYDMIEPSGALVIVLRRDQSNGFVVRPPFLFEDYSVNVVDSCFRRHSGGHSSGIWKRRGRMAQ